jgi:transposase
MEDVLDVYTRPFDEKHPTVTMDEKPVQLIGETRRPLKAKPGKDERFDFEYKRNGVANLFMLYEPLAGRRHVTVRERKTNKDWAEFIREMVDVHYAEAERITLVMDNLSTHKVASLYEVFEPSEARRIAQKLEIHYTPKHGSWLNMAEIELSVMSRQCLKRRIADKETLQKEVRAWEKYRNESKAAVDWRFTTEDARIKLKRLYPSIHD